MDSLFLKAFDYSSALETAIREYTGIRNALAEPPEVAWVFVTSGLIRCQKR